MKPVALIARHGDECVFSADAMGLRPLWQIETDEDFVFSLSSKLMGQVNLVRYGLPSVREGGSITLTSGTLSQASR